MPPALTTHVSLGTVTSLLLVLLRLLPVLRGPPHIEREAIRGFLVLVAWARRAVSFRVYGASSLAHMRHVQLHVER